MFPLRALGAIGGSGSRVWVRLDRAGPSLEPAIPYHMPYGDRPSTGLKAVQGLAAHSPNLIF